MTEYFGKYKGWVRRNDDPQGRGRLICYCPQVMGPLDDERHWLHWAEACLPWIGGLNTLDFGNVMTKKEFGSDVGVWLEFEAGNVDFPIWVGTFLPVLSSGDKPHQQLDLSQAKGVTGGSILENPSPGSDYDDINPPKPRAGEKEVRLLTKVDRDIIIGVDGGGMLVLSSSGAHITGPQVTLNGRLMDANSSEVVG